MYEYDEAEIDLLDIFKRILKKWKVALLFGIIFAILFNIFFVYKEYMESKKTWELLSQLKTQLPECTYSIASVALDLIPDDNEYDTSKITKVINGITKYDSYNEEIDALKEKIEESYYLKLDKEAVPTYDTYYFISVDSSDWDNITKSQKVADVSTIICNYLLSEEVINNLLSSLNLDLDPILFKDLIVIWTSNDVLTIRVYGQTREDCEKISDQFKTIIEENMQSLSNSLKGVNFTVSYIGDNYIESDGKMIISAQNNYYNSISSIEEKIDDLADSFETDEKKLYDEILTVRYVTEHGTPEEIEEYYTHKNSIISIKGIAIGFILGVVLFCGLFVLDYILGDKLRVVNDISQRFGLSNCKTEDNVLAIMKKKDFSKLAILGTGKDKISIPNVSLSDADSALLAEQIDVTCMKDVYDEIEQCKQLEIPILGYIIVEQ